MERSDPIRPVWDEGAKWEQGRYHRRRVNFSDRVVSTSRSCGMLSWRAVCVRLVSVFAVLAQYFVLCFRYSDLGGISGILQEVRELIEYPLVHPEVYAHLGIEPVRRYCFSN